MVNAITLYMVTTVMELIVHHLLTAIQTFAMAYTANQAHHLLALTLLTDTIVMELLVSQIMIVILLTVSIINAKLAQFPAVITIITVSTAPGLHAIVMQPVITAIVTLDSANILTMMQLLLGQEELSFVLFSSQFFAAF